MADERKRRRMESNRESARRSRIKKQQQLQQIISDIDYYKRRNVQIVDKIDETKQRCSVLESEIETFAAMKIELEQRLCRINLIIDENEMSDDDDVVKERIWKVGCWSDDCFKINCGDGFGNWSDDLGIEFDVSVSQFPWRMRVTAAAAAASSSTATLSRT